MPAISYLLENHNFNFSLSVYLSVLRTSAFRFYQNPQVRTGQNRWAGLAAYAASPASFLPSHQHQHVGDGHRALPVDCHGTYVRMRGGQSLIMAAPHRGGQVHLHQGGDESPHSKAALSTPFRQCVNLKYSYDR